MDPRLEPLADLAKLHTRLYLNCFRDVGDEAALARPETSTGGPAANSMAFLGAHLVDARRYLLNLLGPEVENPFPELGEGQGIDDFDELPTVAELTSAWSRLGEVLEERLESVTAEHLAGEPPFAFPVEDATVMGGVTFLTHHEAYHVGQLAYLRRLAGLEAMGYD